MNVHTSVAPGFAVHPARSLRAKPVVLAGPFCQPLAGHLYSGIMLALILGYFLLLFTAILLLAKVGCHWALLAFEGSRPALYWPLAGVMGLLLVQAIHHLWHAIWGLVTHQHDEEEVASMAMVLDPQEHDRLYGLATDVAHRVGAPLPIKIGVTSKAECFAIEMRRFGVRPNRQLLLVLGLPHLAVLSVDELQVIMAHELAHFAAGHTRIGVFAFRFLESLRAYGNSIRPWMRWCNPLYWYTRFCFYAFLYLTVPVRRQQELWADHLSAACYGGELAVRTLIKDWMLMEQYDAFVRCWSAHDAPCFANIFEDFSGYWRELSNAGHGYLEQRLCQLEHSSILDSHPTFRRRIEAMRGYPRSERPASPPARSAVLQLGELGIQLSRQLAPAHEQE